MAGYGAQGIQGHHIIPQQIARDFASDFADFLPGWNVNGDYNFGARASNATIAAQMNIGMHNGSHDWLNKVLDALLTDPDFVGADPDVKEGELRLHPMVAGLVEPEMKKRMGAVAQSVAPNNERGGN